MRFRCLIATQSRSSLVFDFGTSNSPNFIFDFMGEVALKSSKAMFRVRQSTLLLIATLALTPVNSSLTVT